MSLFNDSIQYGIETTAIQAGDLSFGKKAGATAAGAVLSGFGSIYNTGVAVGNAAGLDWKPTDTYETLKRLDTDWASYYEENRNAIDIGGFIATSLLPGSLAVKGLNMLRTGENVGAIGRSLNFFRTKQAESLTEAVKNLAVEGGSAFTRINKNKLATMGWETADQALQATVFELGVALTMNQSPLLADDSAWEITKGIAVGAVLGGGIGGGIGALGLNRNFNEAVKAIDARTVKYSALAGVNKLNMAQGDKAYALIDAVTKLPAEVLEQDKSLVLMFNTGSGTVSRTADLTNVLTNASRQSSRAAIEEFGISLREIASNKVDDVQRPFAEFILGKYKALQLKGATPAEIREELGDVLLNLRGVKAAVEEPVIRQEDLWFFRKTISPDSIAKLKSLDELRDLQVSKTPLGDAQKYKGAYVYTGGDLAAEKIAVIGTGGDAGFSKLADAWRAGYSLALQPDNTLAINTLSGAWKRAVDPVLDAKRYINSKTGTISDSVVLTAADKALPGTTLKTAGATVELSTANGTRVFNMAAFDASGDTIYKTARHAWAADLTESALPVKIKSNDISLLEKLRELPAESRSRFTIENADGTTLPGDSVVSALLNSKIDTIKTRLAAGEVDIRTLAYEVNASPQWVEKVIGAEFGAALRNPSDLAEGMSRDIAEFKARENFVADYAYPQQFTALNALDASMSWKDKRDLILNQAREAGGQFVTGELAYAYRVQGAVRATQTAASAVLGAAKYNMLPDLAQDAAKLSNSLGAGATFLASSNASYGEVLKLAAQNSGKFTHQWIQEASDDIVNAFSAVGTALKNNKSAAAEVGIVTNILRSEGAPFVWENGRLVLRELVNIRDAARRAATEQDMIEEGRRIAIEFTHQEAIDFFQLHTKLNGRRVEQQTVLVTARGFTTNKDPLVAYAPPIDTNYFQHFAFVRPIEGKAFGTSEVSMVFGRNAEELQTRIAQVDRNLFDVITKDSSERYFKAKGDYDFDSTINERTIDTELRRTGALNNFFPETRVENILEDYLRWHQNQEAKLIRNAVESKYAQQVEELRQLGRAFAEDATSKFSGNLQSARSAIINPYEDYIKTMLDVSKQSQYRLFAQANEFVDALGTRAYQTLSDLTGKANKGQISWIEANAIAEKHGIKGMYSGESDYFLSNVPRDRNLIKEGVAKANTLLANLVLRFDFAQSIMNVVSTPLLLGTELASIRTLVAQNSELAGALNDLTKVKVPGQSVAVPSTNKLLFNAVKNFHGADKDALIKRYTDNGDIKDTLALYHSAISDLSLSPNFQVFSDGVNRATEKVATLTGNNWSEQFTRFVSADVMRQLTDPLVAAGKLELKTQNTYISTFVNRVQGNYIASQRPVVFQGVIGGAIGLFQTYSFNLLQQLLRHVSNKDKRAVATLFGMQAGLFGLNGTPMFDAINTHIIGNASINDGHYDAYSLAPSLVGKEGGDWLMYGTVSAFPAWGNKAPALYTRGDINPRHMTILPTTLADIPAIDASTRVISNLVDVGSKLLGGGDVTNTLLQGLEHNGLNRPLAGFAQLAQGQSTTSRGGVISAMSDLEGIAAASRIIGTKTMDEAIALNNLYRLKAYDAADRDRMEKLGERVKTHLSKNQVPPDEVLDQFLHDYTSIGGRPEQFNAALQRWMKDANVSVVEKMRAKINSAEGQRLNEIMGGVPLEDWRNTPAQETAGETTR